MISKLTGVVDRVAKDHLVLDVQGVGYQVFASARTLGIVGGVGSKASLMIETHVREDHIHLFGFSSVAEQDMFRLLTSVQGVGARTGLAILSVAPIDRLALALAAQDKAVFAQADGVGPKLATRIVTELKDKAAGVADSFPVSFKSTKGEAAPQVAGVQNDAVSALINLGYARSDAYSVVHAITQSNDNPDLSTVVRLALKELSA